MVLEMATLQEFKNAVAQTASEKYQILQNRDKFVRAALGLHMKKQTELSEAKKLRGTCLDMCPEMERYVREDRRRLSVYEIIAESEMTGRNPLVDHKLAVKEYSRSSADQDLPLPHELRPAPVLLRTMHYLLNNIADKGEDGKWADWFDFLWNRTRGIRKEITQLQLCDLTAVDLVEKCARFHIYCGERLCEEDMMVFDEKINNENLTKCLQTLKELYHDLETQQITCPNEAEFRAYMVLMHLNSGDILREVQQLRQELRQSHVIGFVVRVYSALNSNNYVQFFKLVRQANFLNACIMHRYFYQVRMKAFRILNRSYNKKESCPASELVRVLGFENEQEAVHFCTYHGLQTDGNNVFLDRAYFVEPETAYSTMRARNTIESKKITGIGETINGEPLPPNIIPESQQNSFDANGRFIATELESLASQVDVTKPVEQLQERESVGRRVSPVSRRPSPVYREPSPVYREPSPVFGRQSPGPDSTQQLNDAKQDTNSAIRVDSEIAKPQIPNEIVKEIAKSLFFEVIGEFVNHMSSQLITAVNVYLNNDRPISEDIIDSTLQPETRALCEEVVLELENEAAENRARIRAEYSLLKQRAEVAEADSLLEEAVDCHVQLIAHDQIRLNELGLKQQSMERCSKVEMSEILNEVLDEESVQVLKHVYETDVVDRINELEQNQQAVELLRTARFWNRWKNRYTACIRLQRAMLTFPPTPSFMSSAEQFQHLVPKSKGLNSYGVNLGAKRVRVTLQSPLQVTENRLRLKQHMVLRNYWREKRRDVAYAPLDVAQIVQQELQFRDRKVLRLKHLLGSVKIHFKMLVCLPCDRKDNVINDWLTAKLSKGGVPPSSLEEKARYLSMYSTHSDGQPIGVCVNALFGNITDADLRALHQSQFLNTVNAILVVLPCRVSSAQLCQDSRKLLTVLQNLRNYGKPSVSVLCTDTSAQESDIEAMLDLPLRMRQEYIASYTINVLSTPCDQPNASKTLKTAIRELVTESHAHYSMESVSVTEYVENSLHKYFFTAVYEHDAKGSTELPVNDLVEMYNSLIEHITNTAYDEQLILSESVCKFVERRVEVVRSIMNDLTLPSLDEIDVQDAQQVRDYINEIASTAENSTAVLCNSVAHVIRQWQKKLEWAVFDEETSFPWTSVVMICVQFKLNQLSAAYSRFITEEGLEEFILYFRRTTLETFTSPHLILDAMPSEKTKTPISTQKRLVTLDKASAPSVPHEYSVSTDSQMYLCTPRQQNETVGFLAQCAAPENNSETVCREFEWTAAREKSQNDQFEKYLQSVLEAGCPV